MSIVLNVATGNIGGHLATKLLDAGANITVINRSAEKVKHLADRGARVVVGQIDQPDTLDSAFAGASALFWLNPPRPSPDYFDWYVNTATAAASAARRHGITRVVVISGAGASYGRGTGMLAYALYGENAFKAVIPHVAILRPGFFFENAFRDMQGAVGGTVYQMHPDVTVPWVATADIANRAASFLLNANWQGHRTVGVHGPNNLNYYQFWDVISRAVGRPIKLVHISREQFIANLTGFGVPLFMVEAFADMYDGFGDGRAFQAEPNTPDTFAPTTLHEWARQVFKPAFEAAVAAATTGAAVPATRHGH